MRSDVADDVAGVATPTPREILSADGPAWSGQHLAVPPSRVRLLANGLNDPGVPGVRAAVHRGRKKKYTLKKREKLWAPTGWQCQPLIGR